MRYLVPLAFFMTIMSTSATASLPSQKAIQVELARCKPTHEYASKNIDLTHYLFAGFISSFFDLFLPKDPCRERRLPPVVG